VHPATAQQLQQQGLGLVIAMVGGKQHLPLTQCLPEGQVAGMTRRRLQALHALPFDLHPVQRKRHGEAFAKCTALFRPFGGMRGKTVVDMQGGNLCAQLAAQTSHEMQQHGGIEPAAEGDQVTTGRRQRLQGREEMVPERLRHG
jgi:hypothetical protein